MGQVKMANISSLQSLIVCFVGTERHQLGIEGLCLEMKRAIITGTFERAETEACRRLVEPGDLILDCGGAIGYIGLFCLEQRRASRVVSVEANPHSIKLLRRNYQAHSRCLK